MDETVKNILLAIDTAGVFGAVAFAFWVWKNAQKQVIEARDSVMANHKIDTEATQLTMSGLHDEVERLSKKVKSLNNELDDCEQARRTFKIENEELTLRIKGLEDRVTGIENGGHSK